MGQTLTHGIYLPDEGERNCYNGLAGNWQLLDGAVGTVAEHTTQIAGKAPLVHTHTKSDITDFPALANVATSGSYNDLSNIPASFTPASHTHGNLTNDGKLGTTANKPLITGTDGVVQAGSFGNAANTFCEGNDSRLSDARTPVSHTHGKADITNLFNSANMWSADQTFSAKILTKTANTEIAGDDVYQCLKSDGKRAISFRVSNNSNYRTLLLGVHDTNNSPPKGLVISNDNSNNITIFSDQPGGLGTSTNKWKTLNGVNPGALSLPDMSATGVDISGSIVPPSGETTINISGGVNTYTATVDGWLCISKTASACRYIKTVINSRLGQTTIVSGSITGAIYHCQPVPAGRTVSILLDADSQAGYYFYPCLGNV